MGSSTYRITAGVAFCLVAALFPGACSSSSAGGICTDTCDKQETCGDIDSVKADQCRAKCDANADLAQAALDACANKSDIIDAANQCLDRACTDYAKCFETLPSCGGGSSSSIGGGGSVGACDEYEVAADACCDEIGGSAAASCKASVATSIAHASDSDCQKALVALGSSCGGSSGGSGGNCASSGDPCASDSDCCSDFCSTQNQCE